MYILLFTFAVLTVNTVYSESIKLQIDPVKACLDPLKDYVKCGPVCPSTCENYNNTCLECIERCVPGCFCKSEYLQNAAGDCVKPDDCPVRKCTGPNENFDWCPATCPIHENCSIVWEKIVCNERKPRCCNPQCRCNPGFYRNEKHICVSAKECGPNPCPIENMVYTNCINPCPIGSACIVPCIPGCVCAEGYVLIDKVCVKKEIDECGEGGYWTNCINPCNPKCSDCFEPCVSGCRCKEGYVNENGKCVKKTCEPNGVYTDCVNPCTDKIKCAPCVPGCKCDKGYINDNGRCRPIDRCGPNGRFTSCTNPCPIGTECFAPCIPGCICDKGSVEKEGYCYQNELSAVKV